MPILKTDRKTPPRRLPPTVPAATRPTCPKCSSRQVLYTRRAKLHWCRRCGAEFTHREAFRA